MRHGLDYYFVLSPYPTTMNFNNPVHRVFVLSLDCETRILLLRPMETMRLKLKDQKNTDVRYLDSKRSNQLASS